MYKRITVKHISKRYLEMKLEMKQMKNNTKEILEINVIQVPGINQSSLYGLNIFNLVLLSHLLQAVKDYRSKALLILL